MKSRDGNLNHDFEQVSMILSREVHNFFKGVKERVVRERIDQIINEKLKTNERV